MKRYTGIRITMNIHYSRTRNLLFTALLFPLLWTLLAAIVLTLAVPRMCEAADPVRRLFLDHHHIQSMTGLSRVYHQPVKDPAPVIVPDKPWETTGWVRPVGWYPYGSHTQVWSPPVWNGTRNCPSGSSGIKAARKACRSTPNPPTA
jgi:hypothetical protein